MNKLALEKLERPNLQQLAKSEGMRANAKSKDIINSLLRKFPHGVPRSPLRISGERTRAIPRKVMNRQRLTVSNAPTRSRGPSRNISGNKVVRSVKRQITRFIDEGTGIQESADEIGLLLAHTMTIANELSKDIREISWMRNCVEMDVMYELKHVQALWDGTHAMSDDEERQKREDLLKNTI